LTKMEIQLKLYSLVNKPDKRHVSRALGVCLRRFEPVQDSIPLAVEYYMNGSNFRSSAENLARDLELDSDERPTKLAAVPMYFLASHAAELYLKAALFKRGFVESELKKFDYRHNLSALLAEVQKKGVPVSEEAIAVVNSLSEQHKSHRLRYTSFFAGGQKMSWPALPILFATLDELLLLCRISTHGI
jgi:hypothetical protein